MKNIVFSNVVAYSVPCGEHGSERGEGGSVLLQGFELVPQFHHGLGHHGLLVLILALQVGQSDFSCLWAEKEQKGQSSWGVFPATRSLLIWTI